MSAPSIPIRNNLTLVRLVLASSVIWTHAFWRLTGDDFRDGFTPFIGHPISSFAVDGFFFLSGFLVYASLLRRGSPWDFERARLGRLWPGLAVAVLLIVLAGAFITSAAPAEYLRGDTARFVLGNLSLTKGQYTLTGILHDGAPANVNGSLWTIPWEVRCYLVLFFAALFGVARPKAIVPFLLVPSLIFALALHLPPAQALLERSGGHGLGYYLPLIDRLWTMFALGMAAFLVWPWLRLSWAIGAGLVVALMLSAHYFPIPHLDSVVTGYLVLLAGFRTGTLSADWPDYSYGMYIYAFPVMMALTALFAFRSPPLLALCNALATLPLAALSWHFIEHPVLEKVRKRNKRVAVAA